MCIEEKLSQRVSSQKVVFKWCQFGCSELALVIYSIWPYPLGAIQVEEIKLIPAYGALTGEKVITTFSVTGSEMGMWFSSWEGDPDKGSLAFLEEFFLTL